MSEGFELRNFGERTKKGFAKSYQFALDIKYPSGLSSDQRDEQELTTYCQSMVLPQRMFDVADINFAYGKPPIKIARQVRYNNWSVTFRDTPGLQIRSDFLKWQGLIQNVKLRDMTYNTPSVYKSDGSTARVKIAPGEDSSSASAPKTATYTFYGLFPSDVQGVSFGHGDDSIVTYSVEFTYDFFTISGID
jgi:hypothetical protein